MKHTKASPSGIDTAALDKIDNERGKLAHAHFEASPNPGDDRYRLVRPKNDEVLDYDPAKIEALTQMINDLLRQLLVAEYRLRLGPLPRL